MAVRELHLDGTEVTVLKALGTSGTPMFGELLIKKLKDLDHAQFVETLTGLIDLGYVVSNKVNIRLMEDVERAFFRVNSAYCRELRDALRGGKPRGEEEKRRRRRRG